MRSDSLVTVADRFAPRLPAHIGARLDAFRGRPHPSGALLLRDMCIGDVPATPPSPRAAADTAHARNWTSEVTLLSVAFRLGQPVGYLPEQSGDIVQNILPVRGAEGRQTSTSSRVELMFHTEAAFHPHRPRYLLLLCLRGDPAAKTTLCSIADVLPHLDPDVVDILFQPRFRTAVDESYLDGRRNVLGPPVAVLSGPRDAPQPEMVFDADLMIGIDAAADAALTALADAVATHATAVVLEAGDLLVVDNRTAVHGRSPFTPRFDGTDRWVQRAFVVEELASIGGDLDDRVVTTQFGD